MCNRRAPIRLAAPAAPRPLHFHGPFPHTLRPNVRPFQVLRFKTRVRWAAAAKISSSLRRALEADPRLASERQGALRRSFGFASTPLFGFSNGLPAAESQRVDSMSGDEEQTRLLEEAIKKVKDQGFYMKRAIVRASTPRRPFLRAKAAGLASNGWAAARW